MLHASPAFFTTLKSTFKISIALCTFNGSKFLEQLASYLLQTRLPDEHSGNLGQVRRDWAFSNSDSDTFCGLPNRSFEKDKRFSQGL